MSNRTFRRGRKKFFILESDRGWKLRSIDGSASFYCISLNSSFDINLSSRRKRRARSLINLFFPTLFSASISAVAQQIKAIPIFQRSMCNCYLSFIVIFLLYRGKGSLSSISFHISRPLCCAPEPCFAIERAAQWKTLITISKESFLNNTIIKICHNIFTLWASHLYVFIASGELLRWGPR